jgi:4-aminobutyrate aminotransferase-like enzyme
VVKVLAPLTISDAQFRDGLGILQTEFSEAYATRRAAA